MSGLVDPEIVLVSKGKINHFVTLFDEFDHNSQYKVIPERRWFLAKKEILADKEVTTTQLASVLGLTARRVRQLTQDGVVTTSAPASSSR